MFTSILTIPPIRKRARTHDCAHAHTQTTTTGAIRFYAGDIVDTTRDELVCLDCGRIATRKSYRLRPAARKVNARRA